MAVGSRIFISYRRDDAPAYAGRLFDQLSERFGESQVFMDVDTLEPGVDFFDHIEESVGTADVLIAVIGKGWATAVDEHGRRRLDQPEDWVRLEVGGALRRKIRVIPVLVGGATMPRADELPEDLAPLTRRNSLELTDLQWRTGSERLFVAVDHVLAKPDMTEDPLDVAAAAAPVSTDAAAPAPLPASSVAPAEPHRAAPPRLTGRRKAMLGVGALVLLGVAGLLAFVLLAGSSDSTGSETSGSTFDTRLADAVTPLAEKQRLLSRFIRNARATAASFARIRSSARQVEESTLRAQGALDSLAPETAVDQEHRSDVGEALQTQLSYARTLASLPAPSRFEPAAASVAVEKAATVSAVYETASVKVPDLPDMAVRRQDHTSLIRIAAANADVNLGGTKKPSTEPGVGVPSTYAGLFTSADRRQRCSATRTYVYCSSGPSGRAVRLNLGSGVADLGERGSTDPGGNSMPMGTSFKTPDGRATCDSSSRGIRCSDLTTGAFFVLGDNKLTTSQTSQGPQSKGVPSVYTGPFTAVDRLERCYITDALAMCTAGPSGKGVRLVAGQRVYYDGLTGSADHGGPSMPMGTSFRTPAGTIECESSSAGITCKDLRTRAYFVIGDQIVRINNGAGESQH